MEDSVKSIINKKDNKDTLALQYILKFNYKNIELNNIIEKILSKSVIDWSIYFKLNDIYVNIFEFIMNLPDWNLGLNYTSLIN